MAKLVEQGAQLLARIAVETNERIVENEHSGTGEESLGKLELPQLAA